tara:strand:- start:636 stop:1355 length:720 start_codon:yes stop_codon:yes gene_type:complete
MINHEKWIKSLPNANTDLNSSSNQLNHEKWVNTIPVEKKYNSVKMYSLVGILSVCGLLLVSAVKNETRSLQKEINNLQTSINLKKFDLDQAILDHEVITSPENISLLAKKYLDTELEFYKRSQIKKLDGEEEKIFTEKEKTKDNKQIIASLPNAVKLKIKNNIKKKKTEVKKLKEIYSDPKSIPSEVKNQVSKQIEDTKDGLKNLYQSPKDSLTLAKVGKWSAVQLVKAFLGMPIVPGR